jgi:hydroxyacylglutathione hydrolase
LPDEVVVYPTHGAGSFCSAPGSFERVTTIGNERKWNHLAQAKSEEEFVAEALKGLPSYPTYFHYLRSVNQLRSNVLLGLPLLPPLSPNSVREEMARGIAVVDARPARAYAEGHIPGAYGIPLNTPLGTWVGWILPFGSPLILVADEPRIRDEAVRQLVRIGFDDLRGFLDGGMEAWAGAGLAVNRVPVISVEELHQQREKRLASQVLDVRQNAEWRAGHLPGALQIEAGNLTQAKLPVSAEEPLVVHCGHAERSTVALSLLERRGFENLLLLAGGFGAWKKAGYPVERDDE